MRVLLDRRRRSGVVPCARSALLSRLLGFHRPLHWTRSLRQGWVFSSAQPPAFIVSKLVFTLHSFAVISRSNSAPCWSVKAMHHAEKNKKKSQIELWLLAYLKNTRVELHQRVTRHWLWYRPCAPHLMLIRHIYTHAYIQKLLVRWYDPLHTWKWWMHVQGSFSGNGIWATRSAAFVSGQQCLPQLPENIPMCFLDFQKDPFKGKEMWWMSRECEQRSFTRPPLVGDCWMSRWVDGRWCCDLRCHAPATFPRSDSPLCLTPGDPDITFRPPTSPHPSTSVSSPPEPGVLLASSLIYSGRALHVKEKKKKKIYIIIIVIWIYKKEGL